MMRNPEITATFMVPDYSEEVQFYALADKLIEFSQINDTTHLEYGVYLDGYMIGFVNDCGYDDEAIELGYVIDPAFKGRGFATEAVNAVINELHEMGFKKVVAGFFEGNIGSRKVMEKCGMHLNGNSDYEEYRGKKFKCYECEFAKAEEGHLIQHRRAKGGNAYLLCVGDIDLIAQYLAPGRQFKCVALR